MRFLITALLLVGCAGARAAGVQVTFTAQEQQQLFSVDGAFDACLKGGGQRCVLIQDWLKSKLLAAEKEKPEDKKLEPEK